MFSNALWHPAVLLGRLCGRFDTLTAGGLSIPQCKSCICTLFALCRRVWPGGGSRADWRVLRGTQRCLTFSQAHRAVQSALCFPLPALQPPIASSAAGESSLCVKPVSSTHLAVGGFQRLDGELQRPDCGFQVPGARR